MMVNQALHDPDPLFLWPISPFLPCCGYLFLTTLIFTKMIIMLQTQGLCACCFLSLVLVPYTFHVFLPHLFQVLIIYLILLFPLPILFYPRDTWYTYINIHIYTYIYKYVYMCVCISIVPSSSPHKFLEYNYFSFSSVLFSPAGSRIFPGTKQAFNEYV